MAEPLRNSTDSLFSQLRDAAGEDWSDYTGHAFVQGLGDGSLPEACFRHYLIQDYLFLIHFARAYALAAYKSETLEDLRAAARTVSALTDTELGLHVQYCAGWGLTEADMAAMPEATATMAYTRYVLERGMAGDVLDLYAALAPCVVGYAEIGAALNAEMYSGADYQDVADRAVSQMDGLFERRGGPGRMASLAETFRRATRLEIGFWDMGLDRSG